MPSDSELVPLVVHTSLDHHALGLLENLLFLDVTVGLLDGCLELHDDILVIAALVAVE